MIKYIKDPNHTTKNFLSTVNLFKRHRAVNLTINDQNKDFSITGRKLVTSFDPVYIGFAEMLEEITVKARVSIRARKTMAAYIKTIPMTSKRTFDKITNLTNAIITQRIMFQMQWRFKSLLKAPSRRYQYKKDREDPEEELRHELGNHQSNIDA